MLSEYHSKVAFDMPFSSNLMPNPIYYSEHRLSKLTLTTEILMHYKSKTTLGIQSSSEYGKIETNRHRSSPKKKTRSQVAMNANVKQIILTKHQFLIEKILSKRKDAIRRIIRAMQKFKRGIDTKKHLILLSLIELRSQSAIMIQKHIRRLMIAKHVKSLMVHDLIFLYSLNSSFNPYEKSNKDQTNAELMLQVRIMESGIRTGDISLIYSRYLKCYYIPIKKQGVIKKRIMVNFILNGNIIIDPRYDIIRDNENRYVNVIDSSEFYKKTNRSSDTFACTYTSKKSSSICQGDRDANNLKNWESISIFHNEILLSNLKDHQEAYEEILNQVDIAYSNRMNNVKPILKIRNANRMQNLSTKRVTFSHVVEYSY